MIDIEVLRGAGDYRGDDIVEPLLGSVAAARERGRVAIDDAAAADEVRLVAAYTPALRPGLTVRVHGARGGPLWQARVLGVRHELATDPEGNVSIETQISVRRPRAPG